MAWVLFYLLLQQSDLVEYRYKKLMFYYPNGMLLLFYMLIGQSLEPYLAQFKKICLLSIISNFVIIILNYHGIINDTYKLMNTFCGLVFALSAMILYSGSKHGTFNRYENE